MKIDKVYALSTGDVGRIHTVPLDSMWSTDNPPNINDQHAWKFRGTTGNIRCDWRCPATWVKLIPTYRGHLATLVTFPNGENVII